MRVDSYNSSGVGSTSVDKTAEAVASQQKAAVAAEAKKKQDSVELSGLSQALSEPAVDQARLDRLHQAVSAGTYSVSAGELSSNIVNDALGKS